MTYYYVEFHADDGCGCAPGRRRFTDAATADLFWDAIKAERGHRCANSHSGFQRDEFLPEIGRLEGRFNSNPKLKALLCQLTRKIGPQPIYPTVNRTKMPRKIARLQTILDRYTTRLGCVQTRHGVLYWYGLPFDRPIYAEWPCLQSPWKRVFWPLVIWNNRIVCKEAK